MTRLFITLFCCALLSAQSNTADKNQIKQFYDLSLLEGHSYEWLDYLSNRIGSRLSGSLGAERAVAWTKSELDSLGLDRVYLQPVKVPKWVRGPKEFALIETAPGVTFNVPITALGGSVATPSVGLKAPVVEVQGIEDLAKIGRKNIEGKIVFFNRPMQANLISTFQAYSGCVDQRYDGAATQLSVVAMGLRGLSLSCPSFFVQLGAVLCN